MPGRPGPRSNFLCLEQGVKTARRTASVAMRSHLSFAVPDGEEPLGIGRVGPLDRDIPRPGVHFQLDTSVAGEGLGLEPEHQCRRRKDEALAIRVVGARARTAVSTARFLLWSRK